MCAASFQHCTVRINSEVSCYRSALESAKPSSSGKVTSPNRLLYDIINWLRISRRVGVSPRYVGSLVGTGRSLFVVDVYTMS